MRLPLFREPGIGRDLFGLIRAPCLPDDQFLRSAGESRQPMGQSCDQAAGTRARDYFGSAAEVSGDYGRLYHSRRMVRLTLSELPQEFRNQVSTSHMLQPLTAKV